MRQTSCRVCPAGMLRDSEVQPDQTEKAIYVAFEGFQNRSVGEASVSQDGQRFLAIYLGSEAPQTQSTIMVVENWYAQFKNKQ